MEVIVLIVVGIIIVGTVGRILVKCGIPRKLPLGELNKGINESEGFMGEKQQSLSCYVWV